jgi:hypothetical protein
MLRKITKPAAGGITSKALHVPKAKITKHGPGTAPKGYGSGKELKAKGK